MDKSLIEQINERYYIERTRNKLDLRVPKSEFLDLKEGTLYLAIHTFTSWTARETSMAFKVLHNWLANHSELRTAWSFHITIFLLGYEGEPRAIRNMEGPIIKAN